jgi:hypothetical protein
MIGSILRIFVLFMLLGPVDQFASTWDSKTYPIENATVEFSNGESITGNLSGSWLTDFEIESDVKTVYFNRTSNTNIFYQNAEIENMASVLFMLKHWREHFPIWVIFGLIFWELISTLAVLPNKAHYDQKNR